MKGIFTFMPAGGGMTLALNGNPFLSFSGVTVRYATGYEELTELRCTQNEPDTARFVALCRKGSRLTLTFSRQNGLISLDADYEGLPLAGESSIRIYLSFQNVKNMIAGGLIRIPWWSFPCYESDPELWPDRKVGVVQFERAGTHFLFLPLPGSDFSSYLYKGYLTLTTGKAGLTELHGTCLQINGADDPYSAAAEGYRAAAARSLGAAHGG